MLLKQGWMVEAMLGSQHSQGWDAAEQAEKEPGLWVGTKRAAEETTRA